jgi:hypothetical protein
MNPRIRKFSTAPILLGLMLAFLNNNANSGTVHYRWLDDRGYPVHSDRPPPKGIDYEVITTGSGLKREVSAEEGAVPAEVNPRVGNQFTQVDPEDANRLKKNPELCKRAQTNLGALSSDAKVRFRDNNGDERFLTEDEVFVEREKAKAQISVYCP